jgi:hypothetical protein
MNLDPDKLLRDLLGDDYADPKTEETDDYEDEDSTDLDDETEDW